MLMSSMKIAIDSLGRDPNNVFPFLWSLAYIASCVSFALVCAEQLSMIETILLASLSLKRRLLINTDLPTPVPPVNSTAF